MYDELSPAKQALKVKPAHEQLRAAAARRRRHSPPAAPAASHPPPDLPAPSSSNCTPQRLARGPRACCIRCERSREQACGPWLPFFSLAPRFLSPARVAERARKRDGGGWSGGARARRRPATSGPGVSLGSLVAVHGGGAARCQPPAGALQCCWHTTRCSAAKTSSQTRPTLTPRAAASASNSSWSKPQQMDSMVCCTRRHGRCCQTQACAHLVPLHVRRLATCALTRPCRRHRRRAPSASQPPSPPFVACSLRTDLSDEAVAQVAAGEDSAKGKAQLGATRASPARAQSSLPTPLPAGLPSCTALYGVRQVGEQWQMNVRNQVTGLFCSAVCSPSPPPSNCVAVPTSGK